MISALIHIVLNTALVVVLAVIATIVFVIAWPSIRRSFFRVHGYFRTVRLHLDTAARLGGEIGDGPELFRATWGLWLNANRRGGGHSREWTEELVFLAERLGDESLLLEAQHCRWGDEFYGGGNVLRILETTEEGIRRYDAKRHAC